LSKKIANFVRKDVGTCDDFRFKYDLLSRRKFDLTKSEKARFSDYSQRVSITLKPVCKHKLHAKFSWKTLNPQFFGSFDGLAPFPFKTFRLKSSEILVAKFCCFENQAKLFKTKFFSFLLEIALENIVPR
jgi:hypothetical protein